jgi:hypothetical protein
MIRQGKECKQSYTSVGQAHSLPKLKIAKVQWGKKGRAGGEKEKEEVEGRQ